MTLSRRSFFCQMTMGATATSTIWRLEELSQTAPRFRSGSPRSGQSIRLDMNINPYGPSPKVVEIIRANLELVNQYPDSEYGLLAERIAGFHGVKANQIALGCGSRVV